MCIVSCILRLLRIQITMSFVMCCVPQCWATFEGPESDRPLHCFPSPVKEADRFRIWVTNIGGDIVNLEDNFIFKNRRVCHRHFEAKYHGTKNRLSKIAVPMLYLPDIPRRSTAAEMQIPSTSTAHTEVLAAAVSGSERTATDIPGTSIAAEMQMPSTNTADTEIFAAVVSGSERIDIPRRSTAAEIQIPSTSTAHTEVLAAAVSGSERTGRRLGRPTRFMTKQEIEFKNAISTMKTKLRKSNFLKKSFKQRLKLAKQFNKNEAIKNIKKMSKTARTFVQMQITQAGKHARGRRFSLKEKILALSLYKPSPKAYRLLSQVCILPKRKTLQTLLQKVSLKPGLNQITFDQLQRKVAKLPDSHKFCSLIFDEMSISPNLTYDRKNDMILGYIDNGKIRNSKICDHVLVFMVRGVIKKYKQPVSYSFCAGTTATVDLAQQTKDIIVKLQDTGLKVVSTVCDQGATNRSAINKLINETKADYLKNEKEWKGGFFEIQTKKVIPIFDPPHLVKGLRNNLLTKDLEYKVHGKTCVAKWQHIIDLYKRGPGYRGVRLVPKLTAHHVLPNLIPKMRVKHCTQVLSRSVGVALGFMADAGKLPEESKQTADFLLFMDKLFDSVNGSSSKIEGGKIYRTAVTPTSPHHKLWRESIEIIKTMRYVDQRGKTSVVPSLSSWIVTIEGFKSILRELHKFGLNSILLRHFNQDPIENFFGAVRVQGHQNIMPNAAAFQAAYKTLLINNFTSPHSIGSNCEKDKNDCLQTLRYFLKNDIHTVKDNPEHVILEEHLLIDDINTEDLMKSTSAVNVERCAALGYCSGWLVLKAKKRIYKGCSQCKKDLESDGTDEFHKFIKISEYNEKSWLCYPTRDIFEFFVQVENITTEILKTCSARQNILEYVKLITSINVSNFSFLKCSLHKEDITKFLINKSIIFCIHNWCKEINQILCGKQTHWDHNDPIKTAAHTHCIKYKNRKRKRQTGVELGV